MAQVSTLIVRGRREFISSIFLIGVIPFMTFVYIVVSKISSFKILFGEVGYIMTATVAVFLSGILAGRKMLWAFIHELLDYNQKIVEMQQELVQKNKLAAIAETALSLGHEINNPLLTVRGNLAMIENDLAQLKIPDEIKKRLDVIKTSVDRIGRATDKMSSLSRPFSETIEGGTKMINLDKSE